MKEVKKVLIGFPIGIMIFDIINIIFCVKFGYYIELTLQNINKVIMYYLISGIIGCGLIVVNKEMERDMSLLQYKKRKKPSMLSTIVCIFTSIAVFSPILITDGKEIGPYIILIEYLCIICIPGIIALVKFFTNKEMIKKINNRLKAGNLQFLAFLIYNRCCFMI